jgi:hypothetical protein
MFRRSSGALGAWWPGLPYIRARTSWLAVLPRKGASGASVEARSVLRSAVLVMRSAAASQSQRLQVQLALQASRQLVSSFSLLTLPQSSEALQDEALARVASLPGAQMHSRARQLLADASAPGVEASCDYAALEAFFIWLEARIDPRSARERLVSRWLARAGIVAAAGGLVAWVSAPTNLARGQKVTASSICSLTPDAPLGQDRLFRLVDGREVERAFAVCTELEHNPWLMVDLAQPRRVDRVVVYPRNDCCYGEQGLPLDIEISADGKHFEQVATSAAPAIPAFPWRFATGGRWARYVRITSSAKEPHNIVIGEFEVYGR